MHALLVAAQKPLANKVLTSARWIFMQTTEKLVAGHIVTKSTYCRVHSAQCILEYVLQCILVDLCEVLDVDVFALVSFQSLQVTSKLHKAPNL